MNFLYSILSSILGGLLLIIIIALISKKAKEIFMLIISNLLDSDLRYVYKDKIEVKDDLHQELINATFVKILTSRGNDFQQDVFMPIFNESNRYLEVNILMPNPYYFYQDDWFNQRELELKSFDKSFGKGVLKEQAKVNIQYLMDQFKKNIKLKLHQYPLIGRLIITDRYIFFTPMHRALYIRRSKTYKYAAGGDMYRYYLRLFDQLWSSAETYKEVIKHNNIAN